MVSTRLGVATDTKWCEARDVDPLLHASEKRMRFGVREVFTSWGQNYLVGGEYNYYLYIADLIEKQLNRKVVFGRLPDFVTYLGIPSEYIKSLITKQPRVITLDSIHTGQTGNKVIPCELAKKDLNHDPRPFEETIFDTVEFFLQRGLITNW